MMELEIYEREWHGIPLGAIATRSEAIPAADSSFYAAFYDRLLARDAIDPQWIQGRLALADWIEAQVLRPRVRDAPAHLSVLSLGAGLGVMEEAWIGRGYRVSLQECQASSLRRFTRTHPNVPIYIGDARHVDAPAGAFDVIVLAAVDYVYDRHGYQALLAETARLLRRAGAAVMVTVSNLSLGGILRGIAKQALFTARGQSHPLRGIRWGWKRTLSEHIRIGSRCGLQVEAAYTFDDAFGSANAVRHPVRRVLPVSSSKVGVLWRRV